MTADESYVLGRKMAGVNINNIPEFSIPTKAALGALVGGYLGGATADDKHKLRNSLAGMGIGASIGAASPLIRKALAHINKKRSISNFYKNNTAKAMADFESDVVPSNILGS